ncbi:hypothetical protein [Legionella oakridgensis]|nr:hypothetical protein [Legionella oakridgensis]
MALFKHDIPYLEIQACLYVNGKKTDEGWDFSNIATTEMLAMR